MAWPLTGSALTKYNRLLSDLRQYGDFIFVGAPDDITWLQETIIAASDGVLRPSLDDVANRSHYWMLELSRVLGEKVVEPTPCPECPPVVPCPPCPPCPDPRITTTPSGMEDEFGIFSFVDISGLTDFVIHGTNLGQGVTISNQVDLISISAPDLVVLELGLSVQVDTNLALTGFNLPALTTMNASSNIVGYLNPWTSFSLPALTTVGDNVIIQASDSLALTSFSLPVFATAGVSFDIFAMTNPALVTVSLGSVIFGDGANFNFSGDALTAASVNHILARGVASVLYVNGTIDTSGGTSSAPTGQGIADKATLIARGVTVTTN